MYTVYNGNILSGIDFNKFPDIFTTLLDELIKVNNMACDIDSFFIKISPEELLLRNSFTVEEEESAISHMNQDHKEAITSYLDKFFNIKINNEEDPVIARINPFGFDIRLNENLYFYPFPKTIESLNELRQAFKALG